MFANMFSSPSLKSLEQTIEFTERRHAVLAGNIANMSTPGYQSKDLSVDNFQASLRDAIQADRQKADMPPSLRLSLLGSTQDSNSPAFQQAKEAATEKVRDSMRQVVYNDGSDDNLEMQVTQMSKNQSMHTMAVALMKSQFRQLQMAIAGTVNA
jgi:flagellar basal-body rod protein FlgB